MCLYSKDSFLLVIAAINSKPQRWILLYSSLVVRDLPTGSIEINLSLVIIEYYPRFQSSLICCVRFIVDFEFYSFYYSFYVLLHQTINKRISNSQIGYDACSDVSCSPVNPEFSHMNLRSLQRGYPFVRNANYKVGFFTFIIPLETNKQVIFAFIFVFVYRTVSYILPRLLRPRYRHSHWKLLIFRQQQKTKELQLTFENQLFEYICDYTEINFNLLLATCIFHHRIHM